jgi:hypothetical protein
MHVGHMCDYENYKRPCYYYYYDILIDVLHKIMAQQCQSGYTCN